MRCLRDKVHLFKYAKLEKKIQLLCNMLAFLVIVGINLTTINVRQHLLIRTATLRLCPRP